MSPAGAAALRRHNMANRESARLGTELDGLDSDEKAQLRYAIQLSLGDALVDPVAVKRELHTGGTDSDIEDLTLSQEAELDNVNSDDGRNFKAALSLSRTPISKRDSIRSDGAFVHHKSASIHTGDMDSDVEDLTASQKAELDDMDSDDGRDLKAALSLSKASALKCDPTRSVNAVVHHESVSVPPAIETRNAIKDGKNDGNG